MSEYAVVKISGRQYRVLPGVKFTVDWVGEPKSILCSQVLLLKERGKLMIGDPYIKDRELTFDVLGLEKKSKVRVATYKAKANTRKVSGSRRRVSRVVWAKNPRENT